LEALALFVLIAAGEFQL